MSVHISDRVWSLSKSRGSHRLVLLALADAADSDGIAAMTVAELAAKVRVTTRQAQRIVRDLERDGELEVVYSLAGLGPNLYRVTCASWVDIIEAEVSTQ